MSMTARPRPLRARSFGRRQPFVVAAATPAPAAIGDNLKLFATTYAAGFLFVMLFLA